MAAAEPAGDPALVWRAAERLGIGDRGGRARGGRRAADDRRAGDVPPSAGALGGLPGRAAGRPAGRAPGAGRRDRPAGRPRSPGLAPRRRRRSGRTRTSPPSWSGRRAGPQARGGLAAAAAFLERAAALTLDPARRAERALAAAQAKYQAGAFDATLGLLATAEAGPPDQFRRARADLLRGQIAFASSRGSDAPAAAAEGGPAVRAARPAAGARDLPGRAGRRDVRRPPGPGRRDARGGRGGAYGAAAAGAAARARSAAGWHLPW